MDLLVLKKHLNYIFIGSVLAFGAGCSDGVSEKRMSTKMQTVETQAPTKTAELKRALEGRVKSGHSGGLAVSVIDGNQQDIFTLGLADKLSGRVIADDTQFEIGSITKTFTALILADMVLKGEVGLDDPAQKYLPSLVKMPEFNGQKITLKNLATHTSGLPRLPDNLVPKDPGNPYADYTQEMMYDFLSGTALSAPIGEEVAYSNLGMGLLGHILELQAKQSYGQLVTERILKPLAMTDTFIVIPERKKQNFAVGYDFGGEPTSHWDLNTLAGAGALRSDISDMTIYLKANMGLIDTPLSDAIEMSHRFQYEMDDAGNSIGLAWIIQDEDGESVIWHNGGTGGFKSFIGFDLEKKRGTVVLANSQDDVDLIGSAVLRNEPDLLKSDAEEVSFQLSAKQLDRFVGEYQLAPEFIISITRKDDALFLQATGQPQLPIFPRSDMEFFLKVVEASILFEENDDGEITGLILNQGGVQQPASKLNSN